MYSYALSLAHIGNFVTPEVVPALRRTKFRNYELSFVTCIEDSTDEQARLSSRLTRELIAEGTIRPASVHLPFQGANLCWDPSCLEETQRREVSQRFIRLIREHADLMAPMATLHASNEPPLSEHPKRIDQVCRTIEEMIPVAEELNFVINVEFLPRSCVGNCVEELQQIVSRFDASRVGVCLDVNHLMGRWRELPQIIDTLAPRIRSFHLNDYDGVDEMHWMPGQGILDWPAVMRRIRAIEHDVLLILETGKQMKWEWSKRLADPYFTLRHNERACWFLENCEELLPRMAEFQLPGNA